MHGFVLVPRDFLLPIFFIHHLPKYTSLFAAGVTAINAGKSRERCDKFAACINDTVGQHATSVVDTGGQHAAGVVDTGVYLHKFLRKTINWRQWYISIIHN
jgi:hypothetical protein